ncbi:carbohydrate ABC transporter permease [Herbiconiux moechotypicola]|uniref:Carbohydrate ABC transporter permease n=1 Tax=Herbiconiux moechotypicola TaxID=637393 RepID=A0ABN3DWR3_9MICO|nr:carbohydrate ABC transporter permease [Herbiconiux moechotypicola]MCS5730742.1 carbohydrate ABC transporter permease [Herbiconiux moechotypicola]
MRKKRLAATVIMYTVLGFLAVLWLYPIGVAIVKSFAVGGWGNYASVLNHDQFNYWAAIGNSFLLAGGTTIVIVVISCLAAYAFSRMKFFGQKFFYRALLICLAIPVASVVTPLFSTINGLGLRDTYIGVIIPLVAFNVVVMLMLMKSHFDGIPQELVEAATIDGTSAFGIFWRIFLPLSGPAIATISVLSFVYSWNEYLLPNLLISSPEMYPVTQAVSLLQFERMSQEQIGQLYAGLVLMTIPSVLVYLFSQRYLQSGITAGAVK